MLRYSLVLSYALQWDEITSKACNIYFCSVGQAYVRQSSDLLQFSRFEQIHRVFRKVLLLPLVYHNTSAIKHESLQKSQIGRIV